MCISASVYDTSLSTANENLRIGVSQHIYFYADKVNDKKEKPHLTVIVMVSISFFNSFSYHALHIVREVRK